MFVLLVLYRYFRLVCFYFIVSPSFRTVDTFLSLLHPFIKCCCNERSASATAAGVIAEFNIACMGAFTIGNKLREELTDAFLTNEFVPGCSSQPKVDAFREYEAAHQK